MQIHVYEYLLIGNVLHENVHIYEAEIQNIFSLSEKQQKEIIFVFGKQLSFTFMFVLLESLRQKPVGEIVVISYFTQLVVYYVP